MSVPRGERLIVALDVPTAAGARALVERLGDAARFYKVGLELFSARGAVELVEWLVGRACRVFADLKLYDIPETVRRATANVAASGASFVSVHAERAVMEAAVAAAGERLRVLAVTVLTSVDAREIADSGHGTTLQARVLERARAALACGCAGVIASAREAALLKSEFGARLLVVTPGIRPAGARGADDQRRTMDAEQALRAGADYLVVGRPIRDAPDPRAAALALQQAIARVHPA
jgi:orotidine-5'-phosphate decarboxylase